VKVAIVSPYDLGLPGGVQDQAIRLAQWIADLGHEATLIGPGENGPEGAVLLGATRQIKANRASTPIMVDPRVAKRLRDAVTDADVVHIHEPFMPFVSTAATLTLNRPRVGTFHADPPSWARFGYRAGSKLWKAAVRGLDVVTTVSHVSHSAIAPFASARVIPNGIAVSTYTSRPKVPNRVAFLGRDDERKGLQILLDAWPTIHKRIPDASLHVIGTERDRDIDGVTFLGRVDEADKISELGFAEVYCAPNLGGESFGIVVAEGMASGCAVVASAIPAFVGVLGDAGVLVAPGESVALAEAVIKLLSNSEELETRQHASLAAVKRFDGAMVAHSYIETYEEAILRHRERH